ncbi:hypothetical protein FKM82_015290 [Ascaphus truei]
MWATRNRVRGGLECTHSRFLLLTSGESIFQGVTTSEDPVPWRCSTSDIRVYLYSLGYCTVILHQVV